LEASLTAAAVFSLLMLCVQFTGSTGVRNTSRLYVFMPLLWAFSTPLVWVWVSGRLPSLRALAISLCVITCVGGVALFGIELVAIQRPVYSSFINALDARMARQFWNRLEPGSLVFDPVPYRAPALFGLPTDAYLTWYEPKPEWIDLKADPDPMVLNVNGFGYVYLDETYWQEIGVHQQALFQQSCVEVMQEWDNQQGELRRLLDIRSCH